MNEYEARMGSGRDTRKQWVVATPSGRILPTPPLTESQAIRLAEVLNEESRTA